LQRLFRDADLIFLYTEGKAGHRAESRLAQVWILPREGGRLAESPPASQQPAPHTDDRLESLLKKILAAENGEERERGVEALAAYRDPRVREAFLQVLQDSDENVRRSAVTALISSPDEGAVDALTRALVEDESAEVRGLAVTALEEIGGPRALEALERALGDRSAEVRESAVGALARLGGEGAMEGLQRARRDAAENVREAAEAALREIRGARPAD
jgi:HEAT repeat protein